MDTSRLPKPPPFRGTQGPPAPPSVPNKPVPKLPPRLPPRQNEYPNEYTQAPPPPYSEGPHEDASPPNLLNQEAVNRLGRAGVSVPGLDINRSNNASPTLPPRHPTPGGSQTPHMSELQSRFSRMSRQNTEHEGSRKGTSWADKQAALKTTSTLRNDPSKASLSEMKAAASTANHFREHHGEQAATGWRAANHFAQQQGIIPAASPNPNAAASAPPQSPTHPIQGGIKKKPPPPPPPKRKPTLPGPSPSPSPSNTNEPPPIPLGSKPRF